MPTVHTLLVGINSTANVREPLSATNDINLMRGLLAKSHYLQQQQVLMDAQATKRNILSALETMLNQASGEDVCLFYFAGHGSKLECPPPELGALWQQEGAFETLVAYDSRAGGGDIVDKELAHLIGRKMARNDFRGNGHIAVILDSCHSGDASRQEVEDDTVYRTVTPLYEMGIDRFHGYQRGAAYPMRGNHVQLGACGSEELAKDGAFTQILVGDINQKGGQRSYQQVISSMTGDMAARNTAAPKPVCYAHPGAYGNLPFLGGAIR